MDLERNKAIQDRWEGIQSDWYEKNVEQFTIQGLISCAVMTDIYNSNRILEVACGPGRHSVVLAQSFMKPSSVMVSCDFTKSMVDKLKANYQNSEYSKIQGNKYIVDDQVNYAEINSDSKLVNTIDIDKLIEQQGEFNKLVVGLQVNNELLPFQDNYFDSYLANLSLMIVANHKNMLKECYRVLRINGSACFSIWSEKHKNLQFTICTKILTKYMSPEQWEQQKKARSNFHLMENIEQLKQDIVEVGFKGLKVFEQPINCLYRTGQEYYDRFGSYFCREALKMLDEEKRKEMVQEIINEYDDLTGSNTTDLKTFSTFMVVVWK